MKRSFISILKTIVLGSVLFPAVAIAQTNCPPGESSNHLYNNYGINEKSNSNVKNEEDALGYPDDKAAKIKKSGDLLQRGRIIIELADVLEQGDTIYFSLKSDGTPPAYLNVASSSNGVFFTHDVQYTLTSNVYHTEFFVIRSWTGAKYLAFESLGVDDDGSEDDGRDIFLESVSDNRNECYSNYSNELIAYTPGNEEVFDPSLSK